MWRGFGAEMFVPADVWMLFGVSGWSEVDGDKVGGMVLSWSARTKSAEVPLVLDTEMLGSMANLGFCSAVLVNYDA